MTTQNFVSIDFETMTVRRTSACAVGLAVVLDGVIHRKFYSLIRPIPDDEQRTNTFVHGITPEMVQYAPTFEVLFPTLRDLMHGLTIVCHNRNTDINILRDCMAYYGLQGIDVDNNICTYEMTGLPLEACCAQYGINMGTHHDALDDAVACAKVMLALDGKIVSSVGIGSLRHLLQDKSSRSYEASRWSVVKSYSGPHFWSEGADVSSTVPALPLHFFKISLTFFSSKICLTLSLPSSLLVVNHLPG